MSAEQEETFHDLTREQAAKITQILKDDVDWILKHRKLEFDPHQGCRFGREDQEFILNDGECGTCLIGTHLLRHQPTLKDDGVKEDFIIFARDVRIDKQPAFAIYMGAMLGSRNIPAQPRASLVAGHVLQYALTQGWEPNNGNNDRPYRTRLQAYINECNAELQE